MSEWRKSKKKKEANIGFDNAVKYLLIKLLFFREKQCRKIDFPKENGQNGHASLMWHNMLSDLIMYNFMFTFPTCLWGMRGWYRCTCIENE